MAIVIFIFHNLISCLNSRVAADAVEVGIGFVRTTALVDLRTGDLVLFMNLSILLRPLSPVVAGVDGTWKRNSAEGVGVKGELVSIMNFGLRDCFHDFSLGLGYKLRAMCEELRAGLRWES